MSKKLTKKLLKLDDLRQEYDELVCQFLFNSPKLCVFKTPSLERIMWICGDTSTTSMIWT